MKRYLVSFWHTGPNGFGYGNIYTRPVDHVPTSADVRVIEDDQRQKLNVYTVVVLAVSVLGDED